MPRFAQVRTSRCRCSRGVRAGDLAPGGSVLRRRVVKVVMIQQVLDAGSIRSVYQPIIDIGTRTVVAYEALARGPQGPLERPDRLFAAARSAGLLSRLDEACRAAALRGASELGLVSPLTLFVNVEPEVLDSAPLEELEAIARHAPGELRVVLEITERALAARPAELLRTVERVRELGWGIALDDVGAEAASLAFMPLLRPDVVKLDLSLVQQRPGRAVAEIMNAVSAHSERTGAVVLAEGIETEAHVRTALALGATLGQGWFFGRPSAEPARGYPVGQLVLPPAPAPLNGPERSPFACLPASAILRRAPKALLIEVSKQLEREALRLGETCVVASTFQEARHFTAATGQRYLDLAERTAFVCALGEDLPDEPVSGVRGARLDRHDPVRGEWDVVVLAPHFSAALLARDLGDQGPDRARAFEYSLTYDRDTVVEAAQALLSRVAPRTAAPAPSHAPADRGRPPARSSLRPVRAGTPSGTDAQAGDDAVLLRRALDATSSGVTIVDMLSPDQPLVFVNEAFERLAGVRADHMLGRNCRFLQCPDTDRDEVRRVSEAVRRGEEVRATLLNVRGPEREPWWNELHLAPVTDTAGRVVQYIGVQTDVTAGVEAQRELTRQRAQVDHYLARIEQLAMTDSLTGLLNRRGLDAEVARAVEIAQAGGTALALLYIDLDGFKAVNDQRGHAVGDELLQALATRLRTALGAGDLLARLGGDEFLAVLTNLDPPRASHQARRIASSLAEHAAAPVRLDGQDSQVSASIGIAVYPDDASTFPDLLHHADQEMYSHKRRLVPQPRSPRGEPARHR